MNTNSLRAAVGLSGAPPRCQVSALRHKFWDTYWANERDRKVPVSDPFRSFRSVRTIIANHTWHAGAHGPEGGFGGTHNRPDGMVARWNFKLQGVTHDDDCWYFSTEDDRSTVLDLGEDGALFKIPKSLDLAHINRDDVYHVGYPPELLDAGYHHIGDMDYFRPWDIIVAAVEAGSGSAPPLVALFDRDLRFRGKAQLSHQIEAPWCAIEPRTGLLVSSECNFTRTAPIRLQFHRLDRPDSASVTVEWVGEMELFDADGATMPVQGVQGGAFSKNGHLYLAVEQSFDRRDGTVRAAGIRAFDLLTGRLGLWHNIDFKPKKDTFGGREELEGLTLWDLDGQAPGISGQVHVPIQRYGIKLFFRHWGVAREDVGIL
jgi:hypothetical protein